MRRRRFSARCKRRSDLRLCSASDRMCAGAMMGSDLGRGCCGSGGRIGGSGRRIVGGASGHASEARRWDELHCGAADVMSVRRTSLRWSTRVLLLRKPVAPWAETMRTKAARSAMARYGRERCRDVETSARRRAKLSSTERTLTGGWATWPRATFQVGPPLQLARAQLGSGGLKSCASSPSPSVSRLSVAHSKP